jgi:hypothetical protein
MAKPLLSIPDKVFKIGEHELTMSMGMFNDIMRILGNSQDTVELLLTDPNTRDWVIRRLFTPALKPIDNVDDLINPYEIDISPMDLGYIIAWVTDHVMYFTTSTIEQTRPMVERYQEKIASLSQ